MRVDDEDVYFRPRQRERSSFEWLGIITLAIVLGTFITDGIRVLAANAWISYQLEMLAKDIRSERAEARQQAELRRTELLERAAEQKMHSHECRFWWEQYRNSPTAKYEARKMQSCGQ